MGLSFATERVDIFFKPAMHEDINHAFQLFDEFDAWLRDTRIRSAMEWITSGSQVRFDPPFRTDLAKATESPERISRYVEYTEHLEGRAVNMDY